MPNRVLIWGSIFLAGALVILAVFANRKAAPIGSTSGIKDTTLGAASQNNLAPDFSLQKLDGGTISLSQFRGQKPVVLDFWATWCPNCRRDIPRQESFYQKYKDKVEVIGIDLQEEVSIVKDFVSQYGMTYPVVLDPQGLAASDYGIHYTNYHVLIDKNGRRVREIPGDIQEADITSLVQ